MIGTWIWKSVGTQEKLSCLLRVYESYQESCIKSSNINTNINTISNNNSSSVINRGSSEETASVGDMVNSVVNSVTTTSSTLSSSSSLLSTVVAESSDNVTSTNIPTSSIQTQTEPNIQSNIQSNSQANIESIKSDFETAHVSALTPAATQRLVEGLRECFSDLTGLSKQCLPYVSIIICTYICILYCGFSQSFIYLYVYLNIFFQFSGLVEHNPSVAAEWLIILATQSDDPYHRVNSENSAVTSIGSTDVTAVGEGPVGQHLVLLMMMEKNLKSIEVVNRLCSCSTISLPTVFLQSYITGCIESCSFISDVYLQTRRVRLICAFFMSLIRSPSTSTVRAMKSYNVEIQTFCIEFARVKEASTLYRMLKLPPSATESL